MNKSKKYKDAQHRSLSEKCKSKPRGTITRQSGWLLSKSLQAINAGEDVEKEMAIHSSNLAWKTPWTEEPGGVQAMRSRKSWHN